VDTWSYGDRLLKTTNGGINWKVQIDLGLTGITEMKFINENTGWAVGSEGLVIKTTNGGELVPIKEIQSEVPQSYSISQNYPNPFNPSTHFRIRIAEYGLVRLTVYDVLGREVQVIVNQQLSPGTYEVGFDGSDLSSGVYFYTLSANEFVESRKMVLIK
jgi:Secretion system C-terminal sorting domain